MVKESFRYSALALVDCGMNLERTASVKQGKTFMAFRLVLQTVEQECWPVDLCIQCLCYESMDKALERRSIGSSESRHQLSGVIFAFSRLYKLVYPVMSSYLAIK